MPPREVSFATGKFISSLLQHDWKKRLGSESSADVFNARFFEPIDWEATVNQRGPPALIPGAVCTTAGDREAALDAYQRRRASSAEGAQGQGTWFVGLDTVLDEKPACAIKGRRRK